MKCISINRSHPYLFQVFIFNKGSGSGFPFWSTSDIDSPWFNVVDESKLLNNLNKRLDTLTEGKFNVFQAMLTPDETYVQSNLGKKVVPG